jgi:hypothetical protein
VRLDYNLVLQNILLEVSVPALYYFEMPKKRKYYPRLPKAEYATAQAKLAWSEPKFGVRVDESGIDFNFHVSRSGKLRRLHKLLGWSLLGTAPRSWEKAIRKAYRDGKSGPKTFQQCIAGFLKTITRDAVRIWLSQTWNLVRDRSLKAKQLEKLKTIDRIKRGPQPDPMLALRAAMDFREKLSALRDIRKAASLLSNSDLKEKVSSYFPVADFLDALQKANKNSDVDIRAITARDIDLRAIAHHLVIKNLGISQSQLKKVSIAKHIKFGKQLFSGLTDRS